MARILPRLRWSALVFLFHPALDLMELPAKLAEIDLAQVSSQFEKALEETYDETVAPLLQLDLSEVEHHRQKRLQMASQP